MSQLITALPAKVTADLPEIRTSSGVLTGTDSGVRGVSSHKPRVLAVTDPEGLAGTNRMGFAGH